VGPLTAKERAIIKSISAVGDGYEQTVDRESAEEILKARAEAATAAATAAAQSAAAEKEASARAKEEARLERERRANPSFAEGLARQVGKSLQRQAVNRITSSIIRGVLGGLFRGR
jgi:hypothetical protein